MDDEGKKISGTTGVSERELVAFRRFLSLLPHGKGRELVVLKAHLLVEEQLRQIIAERVRNPSAIRKARLSFAHCSWVARAFFQEDHDPDMWQGVALLNEIRNDYAHQLEPATSAQRMERFVQLMQPNGPLNPDPAINFEFALWTLFVSVSGLVARPTAEVLQFVPSRTIES